jgi:hypothetical protein
MERPADFDTRRLGRLLTTEEIAQIRHEIVEEARGATYAWARGWTTLVALAIAIYFGDTFLFGPRRPLPLGWITVIAVVALVIPMLFQARRLLGLRGMKDLPVYRADCPLHWAPPHASQEGAHARLYTEARRRWKGKGYKPRFPFGSFDQSTGDYVRLEYVRLRHGPDPIVVLAEWPLRWATRQERHDLQSFLWKTRVYTTPMKPGGG